eukprot:scaffold33569_cov84-Skeletonema_dohrnii-CCMP3373.AAC.13
MAEAWDDDEIFVYTGGDQVVPWEFHDGIERIGQHAFNGCVSLRSVKLLGVKIIKWRAFSNCSDLIDVEFGVELGRIGTSAFLNCKSLRNITIPSVRSIGQLAFDNCEQLTDLEFGEELETLQRYAFNDCQHLRRVSMPLKDGMIEDNAFAFCPNLTTVALVGGIHLTIASLHLESWRNEMRGEINRINQVLPITPLKTEAIQQWIRSVICRIDHYKSEHKALLKEATTLLELALWKANLEEKEDHGEVKAKRVKIDIQSKRNERRITSGANIIIKNVLPFLELK